MIILDHFFLVNWMNQFINSDWTICSQLEQERSTSYSIKNHNVQTKHAWQSFQLEKSQYNIVYMIKWCWFLQTHLMHQFLQLNTELRKQFWCRLMSRWHAQVWTEHLNEMANWKFFLVSLCLWITKNGLEIKQEIKINNRHFSYLHSLV